MSTEQSWEYRQSWLSRPTKQTDLADVDAHMRAWAQDGWELHSSTTSPYVMVSGAPQLIDSESYVFYAMTWRRPAR